MDETQSSPAKADPCRSRTTSVPSADVHMQRTSSAIERACGVDIHHEQHRAGASLMRKACSESTEAAPRQAKGLNRKEGQQGTWTAFFTAQGQTTLRTYHGCLLSNLSISCTVSYSLPYVGSKHRESTQRPSIMV